MTRTLVMGILNVTPNSFADGGKYLAKEDAINQGRRLIAEGADIVDIGGESTKPGVERVSQEDELKRVIPVITELVKDGATVSVDTMRAEVAKQAIAAGATYVNVQNQAVYEDVVKEVKDELDDRVSSLLKVGVNPEQIILDPGIGFAKESEHNWQLLKNVERLQLLGYPLLIGASRKRFLGELVNAPEPDKREAATIALTSEMARLKVWGVRTHAVRAHRDAISVVEQMRK